MAFNAPFPQYPSKGELVTYQGSAYRWDGEYWWPYGTSSGYVLTGNSLGNGISIFRDATGNTINFKSFSGNGINITDNGSVIVFSGTGGSGSGGSTTFSGGTITGLTVNGNLTVTGNTISPTLSGVTFLSRGVYGSVTMDASSNPGMIVVSGSNTVGGSTYIDFLRGTNTSVGATNPNKTFRINGTGGFEIVNSAYNTLIFTLTDAGVLSTPGGGTSDSRKKENIQYINDETTPHILNLKPVKFEYKDYSGVKRHGFIAQDVLTTYPELVLGDGDKEGGTYGLDYDGILSLTVKSLQEMILKVEKLEKEIKELKKGLNNAD